jgi:hypothetical protein
VGLAAVRPAASEPQRADLTAEDGDEQPPADQALAEEPPEPGRRACGGAEVAFACPEDGAQHAAVVERQRGQEVEASRIRLM